MRNNISLYASIGIWIAIKHLAHNHALHLLNVASLPKRLPFSHCTLLIHIHAISAIIPLKKWPGGVMKGQLLVAAWPETSHTSSGAETLQYGTTLLFFTANVT